MKVLKVVISKTGKSTASTAGTCRFCGTVGDTGLLAIGNVCGDSECQASIIRYECLIVNTVRVEVLLMHLIL